MISFFAGPNIIYLMADDAGKILFRKHIFKMSMGPWWIYNMSLQMSYFRNKLSRASHVIFPVLLQVIRLGCCDAFPMSFCDSDPPLCYHQSCNTNNIDYIYHHTRERPLGY